MYDSREIRYSDLLLCMLKDFKANGNNHFIFLNSRDELISICADAYFNDKHIKMTMKVFKNKLIKYLRQNGYMEVLIIHFNFSDENHKIFPADILCDISFNEEKDEEINQIVTILRMKGLINA